MRTFWLLLSSALFACGGSTSPVPTAESNATTGGEVDSQEVGAPASTESDAAPADHVQIRLLEAGAEPRRVLRYQIPEGATDTVEMTQRIQTTITLEGRRMGSPTSFPIVTRMSFGPSSRSAQGAFVSPFRIDSMELGRGEGMTAAARAAGAAAVEPLVGTTGSIEMDARGRTLRSNIDVPPDVTPQIADTLENMRKAMVDAGVPFPEEAVGVGARWQVQKRVTRRGLQIEVVATYTLRELTAGGGRFDAVVSGSAPPQPFPAANDGSTAELESMTLRGGGDSHFSLSRIASPSNNWVEMDMQALIRAQGQAHGMQMHMRQTITITPVGSDASAVAAQ